LAESKSWHLVCYDVRDQGRWRKLYKIVQGYGQRIQYSIFRCKMTERQMQKLYWEAMQVLAQEDDFLIIPVCNRCAARIPNINERKDWDPNQERYEIY
jgi:CRISPR-associated protein Cas2